MWSVGYFFRVSSTVNCFSGFPLDPIVLGVGGGGDDSTDARDTTDFNLFSFDTGAFVAVRAVDFLSGAA